MFLTFEGVEGGGKSTQMARLMSRLRGMGHRVVENREPGGTRIGRQIRAILLEAANHDLSPVTELLLFFGSRSQAVDEVIRPALDSGAIVVSDRFTDSTLVYQGVARGLGKDTVRDLERVACRGIRPGLTLCLDMDVAAGLERARARNNAGKGTQTRLDDESLAFHIKVREAYHELALAEPDRVKLIDAGQHPDVVAEAIWAHVEPLIPVLP
ncbi:MAG: dTMP kinase [Candidatus Solibacter usitatus]|nr:dTMP kinase [Candidatus Solibacter usitatus]